MDITYLILGVLLLMAGRVLFWLFVGVVGFLVGVNFASEFFSSAGRTTMIFFALVIGIVGALLALGFQWIAIILAGFLGGGYFFMQSISLLGLKTDAGWLIFVLGGIVGIVVTAFTFNWALIGLTSLIGAMLIIENLNIPVSLRSILFLCCVVIGIIVQSRVYMEYK